jgi:hypothetical protein
MSQPVPPPGLTDQLLSGQLPSLEQFITRLSQSDPLEALALLAFGLVCLLAGWKLFQAIVVLNAALLGGLLGHRLGLELSAGPNLPVILAVAGALLVGVLAWPLMKVAVSAMAALMGALIGYAAWSQIAGATGHVAVQQHAWAGGVIGLITLGLLAWVIFRFTVMLFTAFQGAFLSVSAVVALLLRHPDVQPRLQTTLSQEDYVLSLIVLVAGVIGFSLQYASAGKKGGKKPTGG